MRKIARSSSRSTKSLADSWARLNKKEMSLEEENKAVVRRYAEAFNRGDMEALRALLAPDAEIQGVMGHGMFERVEPVWRQLIEGYGMHLRIEELVAEGNKV